uniref:MYND-type domain-containing protein n=1 Tax=Phytophthora ramorum TaxID=164328 RepID=H3GUF1_PHYRM
MPVKMRVVQGDADVSEDVSGDRGRRVEAQTDLNAGDLALQAQALAAVLLPELWGSHCHKCFSSGTRLSRCGRCRTAFYCSRACQQADWQPDHRQECKSLAQLASLGLRSDQVADVLLLGRVMRREEADGVKPQELVWYQEDVEDQELLLLAALAQKLKLVDDSYLMEELQRMLSRFRNNNFSICDELLLELGAGCFPLGAMINHSCDPNCAVTTLVMEFRAMTPIKAGQEITQTYGNVDAFLDADIDGVPQEQWTQERQEAVQRALKEFSDDKGRSAAGATDPAGQQHIDALQKLLEQQSGILHRDNIALLQTLSTLFSAEMERGSVEEAIQYGERVLEFYRRVYHSNHPMTGLHVFTLGDLNASR